MFAPTNNAFAKLPLVSYLTRPELEMLLQYHVLPAILSSTSMHTRNVSTLSTGSMLHLMRDEMGVHVSTAPTFKMDTAARITQADLLATNGMVHLTDTVLVPPALKDRFALMEDRPPRAPCPETVASIPAIASSLPQLSTLVSLLSDAGLLDALNGRRLTLFAPSNDAFSKLPDAFMSFLTRPENKQTLLEVLTYHMVGNKLLSKEMRSGAIHTLLRADPTVAPTVAPLPTTTCAGNIVLSGSSGSLSDGPRDYPANHACRWTISAPGAITLTFSSVALEANYDFVKVEYNRIIMKILQKMLAESVSFSMLTAGCSHKTEPPF